MDKENLLKQMRAERFKTHNGKVIQTINLLRTGYIPLADVLAVLSPGDGMHESEFLDSVRFLHGNEYIQLRHISGHAPVVDFADADYRKLEAIISQTKGVRLLAGAIVDSCIVFQW